MAKDVCDILELSNSRDAITRLDEDEKGVASIYNLGGYQQVTIVNEPGLYTLILGSRKPEARLFKRWITHEVIPQIRKTGGYSVQPKSQTQLILMMAQQKGFTVQPPRKYRIQLKKRPLAERLVYSLM